MVDATLVLMAIEPLPRGDLRRILTLRFGWT